MNTCYVFFKQQNTGWLLVRYTELHQQDAASMSGIKANSEDNLCCAASVTITRRARLDELMCENKLLRWSRDVGKFIMMDVNRRRGGGTFNCTDYSTNSRFCFFIHIYLLQYNLVCPHVLWLEVCFSVIGADNKWCFIIIIVWHKCQMLDWREKKTMICWSKVTFLTNVRWSCFLFFKLQKSVHNIKYNIIYIMNPSLEHIKLWEGHTTSHILTGYSFKIGSPWNWAEL